MGNADDGSNNLARMNGKFPDRALLPKAVPAMLRSTVKDISERDFEVQNWSHRASHFRMFPDLATPSLGINFNMGHFILDAPCEPEKICFPR